MPRNGSACRTDVGGEALDPGSGVGPGDGLDVRVHDAGSPLDGDSYLVPGHEPATMALGRTLVRMCGWSEVAVELRVVFLMNPASLSHVSVPEPNSYV